MYRWDMPRLGDLLVYKHQMGWSSYGFVIKTWQILIPISGNPMGKMDMVIQQWNSWGTPKIGHILAEFVGDNFDFSGMDHTGLSC